MYKRHYRKGKKQKNLGMGMNNIHRENEWKKWNWGNVRRSDENESEGNDKEKRSHYSS